MKGFYLKFTFNQEKLKTINQFKSHIEECFIETYGFIVLKYELIEVAKFHQHWGQQHTQGHMEASSTL
jgi:hypothetical protein